MEENKKRSEVQAYLNALNTSINKIMTLQSQLKSHATKLSLLYAEYLKIESELKETEEVLEEVRSYQAFGVKIDKMNAISKVQDAVGEDNKSALRKALKNVEKYYRRQEEALVAMETTKRIQVIELEQDKREKERLVYAYQNNFIMHLKKLEAEVNNGYRANIRALVKMGAKSTLSPLKTEDFAVYNGNYNYSVPSEPVVSFVEIAGGELRPVVYDKKIENIETEK